MRNFRNACAVAATIFIPLVLSAADAPHKSGAAAKELLIRELSAAPEKEIRMMTVEYAPGASSPPHRHNAQTFVYVLEGAVRMQIEGAPTQTLKPGDTFYEGPADVHILSANASRTERARFLVVMVMDRGAPVAVPLQAIGSK